MTAKMDSLGNAKPQGMLKLFCYPSTPHVYQISPFGLKVESWLRVNNIQYEMHPGTTMGPKGKVPFVEVGGETVADSNIIIPHLKKLYDIDCDAGLSKQQQAVALAVTRMAEEHTSQIIFWWRYCKHLPVFARVVQVRERIFKPWKAPICEDLFLKILPREFGDKFAKRGLAAHTEEQLTKFSNDDLRAISDLLGAGPFFFGNKATTIDCTLFGMLANFLFLPMDFPQKAFVQQECTNILDFMEKFKQEFWPDWEAKCNTPNNW